MEKRNAAIDIFRFFGAIMVIMIHTHQKVPILYFLANSIGRYAVPIFMMITGYYFFKNPTNERKKIIVKKLFRLWVVWQIVYLPIGIISLKGDSILKIAVRSCLGLVGTSISFSGSWYLIATITGILIVDKMRKKNQIRICIYMSLVSLIFGALMTNYGQILPNEKIKNLVEILNPSASIITGVIWITISYLLHKNSYHQKNLNSIIFLVIAVLLTVLEFWFVQSQNLFLKNNDLYFTLPLSVVILFSSLLKASAILSLEKTFFIKSVSTLIFFVHFGVVKILNFFILNPSFLFIYVSIISVLISIAIFLLSKFKAFKWLEILF